MGSRIDMLNQDEILFAEESHIYSYHGEKFLSVTQVIRLAGLGDDFSAVPGPVMARAQRRGSMVHLATQFYDEGCLDMATVHESIRGYVDAYIQFRKDRPIKVIEVEKRMVDVGLGLAGTPDLICFMGGRRCVIDKKTSQAMSKSMGLQTAGYKMLWNAQHPFQPVYDRYGLRLEKSGKYKLVAHDDYDDELAFADCLGREEDKIKHWRLKYHG